MVTRPAWAARTSFPPLALAVAPSLPSSAEGSFVPLEEVMEPSSPLGAAACARPSRDCPPPVGPTTSSGRQELVL